MKLTLAVRSSYTLFSLAYRAIEIPLILQKQYIAICGRYSRRKTRMTLLILS